MTQTLVETSERVAPWIYQRLSGDATLTGLVGARIYRNLAPQGTTYPLITYSLQSLVDLNTVDANHVSDTQLWLIKIAWTGEIYAVGRAIADRVFQLIHGYGPTTYNGVRITKAVREAVIPQPAIYVGGTRHETINHQYRVGAYLAD